MKRTVLYARVSTDEQAEHGYSLESQVDACQKYAAANDLSIVEEISDGFSGAKLSRPGLDRVREITEAGQAEAGLGRDGADNDLLRTEPVVILQEVGNHKTGHEQRKEHAALIFNGL